VEVKKIQVLEVYFRKLFMKHFQDLVIIL